jgi:hypothetical protein
MENKLIPMVDFVLSKAKSLGIGGDTYQDFYLKISNYATFLKQSLKLGFFIPCDENDVPLVEPKLETSENHIHYELLMMEWKEAKDRVLFEGFEYLEDEEGFYLEHDNVTLFPEEFGNFTIEILIQDNLTLTPNALKQFNKTFTQK